MESKEQVHQSPLNIFQRIYDFLVKLLATQTLKNVALGHPLPPGTVESKKQNSGIGSNIICNAGRNMETNELLSVDGENKSRLAKEKAPKKFVSIKEEVDEIRISSRRIKKKTSKGSFSSFDHEVISLQPLKSILRKDSGVSNNT